VAANRRRIAATIRKAGARLGSGATGRPGRVAGTYERVLSPLPWIVVFTLASRPEGAEDVVILSIVHGARDWPGT